MKTKLLTIVLLAFAGMAWGQEKLLTDITKPDYKKLKEVTTSYDFLTQLKHSGGVLEEIVNKNIELKFKDITEKNINEDVLTYQGTYLYNSKVVFVNEKNAKVYVVENKGKQIYFYPKRGVFLLPYTKGTKNEDFVRNTMENHFEDIEYNCDSDNGKVVSVHRKILAENLSTIKKAVILNSSDAITDNTAIAFTNGSNDSKLNVGTNINFGKRLFFNINLYTSSANTGFLYNDKSWKNNTGLTFTVNRIIGRETQFSNKQKCEELYSKRKKYLDSIYVEYQYLENSYANVTLRMDTINNRLKELAKTTISVKERKEYKLLEKELTELKKETDLYEKIVQNPTKYIEDKIVSFDKKNDILKGSKLHWIKGSFDIHNQNISLDSMQVYNGNVINNYPRLSLDLSYNFNRKKKTLLNTQLFTKVIMGNLLDASTDNKTPYLQDINGTAFVFDQTNTQLGKYGDLKKAFWTSQTGMQATWFFVENFGLSGFASHTFALQKEEFTQFKNRYSLLAGFAFKISNEKEVNKATFRILGGFENQLYNTNAFDNFSVKVSMGIPFNLFTKKES